MIKRKLCLRRGFKLKDNLGVLSSKFKKEVVPRMESLLAPNEERNIMVSVNWVPGVALIVVKMGTK